MDLTTKAIVGPNEKGEVLLKSDMVMRGYLERRPNMQPENPVDQDGWLHTGCWEREGWLGEEVVRVGVVGEGSGWGRG